MPSGAGPEPRSSGVGGEERRELLSDDFRLVLLDEVAAVWDGCDLRLWDVACEAPKRLTHVGQEAVLLAVEDPHGHPQRAQAVCDLGEDRGLESDARPRQREAV